MKKIIVVLLIVLFLIQPVSLQARAGGGGSSGGSSGGSGSNSSHHNRSNRTGNPLAGYISFGIISLTSIGFTVYKRRDYAMTLHRQVKEQLDYLDDQDSFWNEEIIKQKVSKCYHQIQIAWSNQDLTTLKKYLTPSLYQAWQIKINWQEFKGQRNILSDIRLLKHDVVSLYDSDDNDEDFFWVYIEGKMDDRLVDDKNQIIDHSDDIFVEYWKFKRKDDEIYLDQILQQNEFEK